MKKPGRRRIRLFVLLCGALVLASIVPLLVSDGVLIRRNRRTLETLEEKYLTRSSSALAEHVAAFYASARQGLEAAADSLRLSQQLTGKDPFTSPEVPTILGSVLGDRRPLVALRAFNFNGQGSFIGPDVHLPEVEFEFRRGFESARDGAESTKAHLSICRRSARSPFSRFRSSATEARGSVWSRPWSPGSRSPRSFATRPSARFASR